MVVHPFMSEALAYGKKIGTEKKRKNSRSCTCQPYFKSFWNTVNIKCVT